MMRSYAEALALGAAMIFAIPLVTLFLMAGKDGRMREEQSPLRALLGDPVYEALTSGEPTEQHYMGNNRLAPDFTLQDREGHPWRLRDHRGQVVVMNFWTVTCRPCVEEMPTLEQLARVAEDRDDIEVVTVSADREWDTIETVVPRTSPLLVLRDADRSVIREKFGTRLFPETWVIDPRGVIRLRVDGRRDWSSPVALNVFESYL